jgi:hypothetical protein
MDNRKVIYRLAIASALAVSIVGCKPKYDEIDNNQVISKPYVLFAGDSVGRIFKTNDGFNYEIVFGADNYPTYAMATSKNNLIFVKKNVHYINDFGHGNNPNPTYTYPGGPPGFDKSIIINIPQWNNRIYLCTPNNVKGLVLNDSNGAPDWASVFNVNWKIVTDTFLSSGGLITSLTFLKEGALIAYDDGKKRFYRKPSLGDEFEQERNGNGLPATSHNFMSHIENVILVADTAVGGKVYYSTDYGANFQAYSGLPSDVKVMCIEAPFDQTVLVGTRSHGIFRLPLGSTTFMPANLGLPSRPIVPSLASKYDFYKGDHTKQYVYAATNQGVYRSEDLGENWTKVKDGNFVILY